MGRYLLGIDNGGTVAKAALFDSAGHELACHGSRVPTAAAPHGWAERDAQALWLASAEAVRGVLAKAQVDPHAVTAVACTGHGNGLYLTDEQGHPTRPGIYSTDSRAQAIVDRWLADGVDRAARPLTRQGLWAGQPNALLAWLAEHEPETLARSRWALMCKDYLRLRLTGQAGAELTDWSGTSLLNVVSREFDPRVLALFGLTDIEQLLPPLLRCDQVAGTVTAEAAAATGLAEGTLVAGGLFDIDACSLAAGLTDQHHISLAAGTWGCNQSLCREPLDDPGLFMASCYAIDGWYLLLEGSPTSAGNLDWFLREWMPDGPSDDAYELASRLVGSVDPRDSEVIFLPYLYGSGPVAGVKGALLGLEAGHTRAHVLRAVYEGVAFAHWQHIQRLLTFGPRPDSVRCTGGAARSAVWMQMFADVFGLSVEVPAGSELGALGAAITAAVAAGLHADLPSAVAAMTRMERRYEPDPALTSVYAARCARSQAAADALRACNA